MSHVIANAYDAFWFIFSHPNFGLRERTRITAQQADKLESEGYLVTRDRGGQCWREWRHVIRHAICTNLDISYVKDEESGITGIKCEIEFGLEKYGYFGNSDETSLERHHDTKLDSSGSTFDEALVQLAKKILEHYGDYEELKDQVGECGIPVCGDCLEVGANDAISQRLRYISDATGQPCRLSSND